MQQEQLLVTRQTILSQLHRILASVIDKIPDAENREAYAVYSDCPELFVPYLYAAQGNVAELDKLHRAGFAINTKLTKGVFKGATPLSTAVSEGRLNTVRYFRSKQVDFTQAITLNGDTLNCLHIAALHCNVLMVQELVKYAIEDGTLAQQLQQTVSHDETFGDANTYIDLTLRLTMELSRDPAKNFFTHATRTAVNTLMLSYYHHGQQTELEANHSITCDYGDFYESLYNELDRLQIVSKQYHKVACRNRKQQILLLGDTKIQMLVKQATDGIQFIHLGAIASSRRDIAGLFQNIRLIQATATTESLKHYPPQTTHDERSLSRGLRTAHFIDARAFTGELAGVTPLFLACLSGHAAMVRQLLAYDANLHAQTWYQNIPGLTPILAAIYTGNLDCITACVEHEWKKNQKNCLTDLIFFQDGIVSPIVFAAFSGEASVFSHCLKLMRHLGMSFSLDWPYDPDININAETELLQFLKKIIKNDYVCNRNKMLAIITSRQKQLRQPAVEPVVKNKTVRRQPEPFVKNPEAAPKVDEAEQRNAEISRAKEQWQANQIALNKLKQETIRMNAAIDDYVKDYHDVFPERKIKNLAKVTAMDESLWQVQFAAKETTLSQQDFLDWLKITIARQDTVLREANFKVKSLATELAKQQSNFEDCKRRKGIVLKKKVKTRPQPEVEVEAEVEVVVEAEVEAVVEVDVAAPAEAAVSVEDTQRRQSDQDPDRSDSASSNQSGDPLAASPPEITPEMTPEISPEKTPETTPKASPPATPTLPALTSRCCHAKAFTPSLFKPTSKTAVGSPVPANTASQSKDTPAQNICDVLFDPLGFDLSRMIRQ